jgi:hypothetical protein
MDKIDKIIEMIVDMIFDTEVDLNDPSETVKQIKAKLHNEGVYRYESIQDKR